MKRHLMALGLVIVLAVAGVWAFQTFFNEPRQQIGSSSYLTLEAMETQGVPDFKTKDLKGETFTLSSLQGKVVILNFWASWCAPCIEEVPSLIKLVKEFKGQVQLIAVSGDSNREDIDVFMKSFPELQSADIKIVWDEDRSLMRQFQVARLPESLVIAKDQKLVKKIVGSIEWYNKDSLEYITSLLAP
ncbi:MAG: TlpA disulfide reductase family protein [Bdellovibrio sp.]